VPFRWLLRRPSRLRRGAGGGSWTLFLILRGGRPSIYVITAWVTHQMVIENGRENITDRRKLGRNGWSANRTAPRANSDSAHRAARAHPRYGPPGLGITGRLPCCYRPSPFGGAVKSKLGGPSILLRAAAPWGPPSRKDGFDNVRTAPGPLRGRLLRTPLLQVDWIFLGRLHSLTLSRRFLTNNKPPRKRDIIDQAIKKKPRIFP